MNRFDYTVCLRIVRSRRFAFDASPFEKILKVFANKLGSIVVDTFKRMRVPREIAIFESLSNCEAFLVIASKDFQEIQHRFNTGQRLDFQRGLVHFYFPRSDHINVYLLPGKNMRNLSDRQLAEVQS